MESSATIRSINYETSLKGRIVKLNQDGMKVPTPEPAATEIDARSEELIHEFLEHARGIEANYPENFDQRKIFEGWAIQKIAALQYTVLQLTEELVALRNQLRAN